MKCTIKNQNGKYIYLDQKNHTSLMHMANNGYASVVIYGKKVYLVDDDIIDDERVIIVEVEGME